MPKRAPTPSTSPKTLESNDAHTSILTTPPAEIKQTIIRERPIMATTATKDGTDIHTNAPPKKPTDPNDEILVRDRLSEPRKECREPAARRSATP
jgi:hypothetical protein